ncbi:MAG: hypothetical protein LCI00_13425 [Chloroflexi bacterium]|nr:hypothetical protein [Chloroflexota bacterium]MCC6892337.1 hypothetical protein [Anaerolineae bacterium]
MSLTNNQTLNRSIGYTVREITTSFDKLYCLSNDGQQEAVLEHARKDRVTYLPVREGSRITAIARREDLTIAEILPLTADWLIAADTPILHLIELFAEKSDRVFLVLQSSRIIGLVAPADLNKVPARASIYLLTAQFEAELAVLVRNMLGEDEAILERLLSPDNITKIRAEHAKANAGDIGLTLFYYLYLADLMTIVAKHEGLRKSLGLKSRSHADSQLDFADIRNKVSHLTGMLITSQDDLKTLNEACNKIIRLSEAMNAPTA